MLKVNNVSKHYDSFQALKHIQLNISEGKVFGLIGPNGAGKSTLMKILSGILEDYKGEISLQGKLLSTGHGELKKILGYVPQDLCLEEDLTAKENLFFFGRLYGLKGKQLEDKCNQMIKWLGLEAHYKKKVSQFSGGMKRRLNIGCALLHDPKVVIMDEPTVGVDPQSRNYIFEMIYAMKKSGVTIIYCSHYMEEIELLCEEIALIDQGTVLENGTVHEIREKYTKPFVFISGKEITEELLVPFGSVFKHDKGYMIETKNPLSTISESSSYLHTNSVEIERLEISKPRLEEVFLKLTGKELRDE